MTAEQLETRDAARLAAVREHVRLENLGDLDGIVQTFGETARYVDEPWSEHHVGLGGVRRHYERLLEAVPDLHIEVNREYVAEYAVLLEIGISGTHLGAWRGLPATGRRLELTACVIFTFDDEGRLAGERAYYDRASLLRQVGLFHEPESLPGRLSTVLTHPITIARALVRGLRGRGR
ncbi:MAG TPA: ester cyclase [Gaiellaceae bacterium]|nr:ester cyclase [Gaiellaceae bacterium]